MDKCVQLDPASTDFKGLTNFICFRGSSVKANVGNEEKQVEGTKKLHPLERNLTVHTSRVIKCWLIASF